MKKIMKQFYFLLLTILLTSCVAYKNSTTTLVSCNYNEKKNQTEYMVFPYGSVSIPDKWEKTIYNKISRQQFFTNSDNIIIAIAFGPYNKYEFNKDGSKKGFEFIKAFYEWESEYFVNNFGLHTEQIESNDIDNFIIWRLFGEYNNSNWDTYFLFGERNGFVKNFAIMKTEEWTAEQKIDFLKTIYLQ
jgi:hypothetical protein